MALREVGFELLYQLRLAPETDHPVNLLAILEYDHGRYATEVEALPNVFELVDIDLAYDDPLGSPLGQLGEHRCHPAARPTPFGPKVNEQRARGRPCPFGEFVEPALTAAQRNSTARFFPDPE
jgi:hypothetical protein